MESGLTSPRGNMGLSDRGSDWTPSGRIREYEFRLGSLKI